jgi:hypothetical protein
LLGEIDFRHPLFATFADARYSDFTKVHFWRHRRVVVPESSAMRVLARFDDGDPAWMETALGKGRVIFVMSGWHPEDSQLALSTKFVPLMYGVLEYAGVGLAAPRQLLVGDALPPASDAGGVAGRWTDPEGATLTPATDAGAGPVAIRPGIHRVVGGLRPLAVAVNLDPAEGRTVPLGDDQFSALGVPLGAAPIPEAVAANRTSRLKAAEQEGRQKLWWWCLIVALGAVVAETWLSGRSARSHQLKEGVAA